MVGYDEHVLVAELGERGREIHDLGLFQPEPFEDVGPFTRDSESRRGEDEAVKVLPQLAQSGRDRDRRLAQPPPPGV